MSMMHVCFLSKFDRTFQFSAHAECSIKNIIYVFVTTRTSFLVRDIIGNTTQSTDETMPPKKTGKPFRAFANKMQRDRNWTDMETEAFATLLADSDFNYASTLETKALKKQANKEVFQSIMENFKVLLADPGFVEENKAFFPEETVTDLEVTIQKLRTKYNNLKKQWRSIVDRAKVGSGLHVEREPKWFQVLHPVLTDANSNSSLEDISSGPADTSLLDEVQQLNFYKFILREC